MLRLGLDVRLAFSDLLPPLELINERICLCTVCFRFAEVHGTRIERQKKELHIFRGVFQYEPHSLILLICMHCLCCISRFTKGIMQIS